MVFADGLFGLFVMTEVLLGLVHNPTRGSSADCFDSTDSENYFIMSPYNYLHLWAFKVLSDRCLRFSGIHLQNMAEIDNNIHIFS